MPIYNVTCQTCGKTFTAKRAYSQVIPKYCSRKCHFASPIRKPRSDKGIQKTPRITTYCKECGKELHVTQSTLDAGRGRFCSASCSGRYHRKGKPPPNPNPRKRVAKRVTLICKICKQPFKVKPYRVRQQARYCSHECANKVNGADHPHYRDRIEKTCIICSATVLIHPYRQDTFKCCSRECSSRYALSQLAAKAGPTSIEQLLLDELDRRSIPYNFQYVIDKWSIDIALPEYKIAIEADGDYWHSLPDRIEKDKEKDTWLTSKGWIVFRFSGSKIRKLPPACIDQVLAHITHPRQATMADLHSGNCKFPTPAHRLGTA